MTTKRIIRISYFTMLTVVGGLLRIPVGSISFTLQTVFVILSAFVLGGRDGAFAQLAYMLLGLVGLPVFVSGGGFSYVIQPSFGYILGFSLGAYITGVFTYSHKTMSTLKIWLSGALGLVAIYIIGMIYQVIILIAVNGLAFVAALVTLLPIAIYFVVDVALIYLIALIYPRITALIGMNGIGKRKDGENV